MPCHSEPHSTLCHSERNEEDIKINIINCSVCVA